MDGRRDEGIKMREELLGNKSKGGGIFKDRSSGYARKGRVYPKEGKGRKQVTHEG